MSDIRWCHFINCVASRNSHATLSNCTHTFILNSPIYYRAPSLISVTTKYYAGQVFRRFGLTYAANWCLKATNWNSSSYHLPSATDQFESATLTEALIWPRSKGSFINVCRGSITNWFCDTTNRVYRVSRCTRYLKCSMIDLIFQHFHFVRWMKNKIRKIRIFHFPFPFERIPCGKRLGHTYERIVRSRNPENSAQVKVSSSIYI